MQFIIFNNLNKLMTKATRGMEFVERLIDFDLFTEILNGFRFSKFFKIHSMQLTELTFEIKYKAIYM